jgi:Uncharacterised nucleotidyltransferase
MLIEAIRDPGCTAGLSARQWHALLQQARRHALLAKLEARLQAQGLFASAPYKARSHMHAARIAAQSSQTAVRFEVNSVLRALRGVDVPLVLMKGAAYIHAGLPPAAGRFVGDVDLMVPRERIDEVEKVLLAHGWVTGGLDAYDERYYREWTHEIPPIQHPDRDTPVDIHHTIAALTSRVHPDATAILAASQPLADPRLRVMSPADMVLHSGVHLFNDEVGFPLRDLFDLHDLIEHFAATPGFWPELFARARLHGLQRVLYHVLHHTRTLLGTAVPRDVIDEAERAAPPPPVRVLIAALMRQRFKVDPADGPGRAKRMAGHLLYLRAHWLRMPPGLLLRHLTVKAWKRWRDAPGEAAPG